MNDPRMDSRAPATTTRSANFEQIQNITEGDQCGISIEAEGFTNIQNEGDKAELNKLQMMVNSQKMVESTGGNQVQNQRLKGPTKSQLENKKRELQKEDQLRSEVVTCIQSVEPNNSNQTKQGIRKSTNFSILNPMILMYNQEASLDIMSHPSLHPGRGWNSKTIAGLKRTLGLAY
ncbi:hypothetical protein KY284_010820 [Solanum tuberosum]|nr:hypothetical protein KY284_010820 [Solanum tuberosum]